MPKLSSALGTQLLIYPTLETLVRALELGPPAFADVVGKKVGAGIAVGEGVVTTAVGD